MKRTSAQSLIEVVVGIVALIPVVLVLMDMGIILLGVQENEWLCRNAARAAACGPPCEATSRAQTIVNESNARPNSLAASNFLLDTPIALQITSCPKAQFDQKTGIGKTSGGPILGTTVVTTAVQIKPFVVHHIFGHGRPFIFKAQSACPISFVLPASAPSSTECVEPLVR